MKLLYFAAVRERLGKSGEEIVLPARVETIADLIRFLGERDEPSAVAFENPARIRAAIDARIVPHDTSLAGAGVVALFPPMTGG
jgi:molybdopterin synthase sulfur carrier subunit